MRFLKKIINKFIPKQTIRKIAVPKEVPQEMYSDSQIAELVPQMSSTTAIEDSRESKMSDYLANHFVVYPETIRKKSNDRTEIEIEPTVIEAIPITTGKSRIKLSNIDNELKVRPAVHSKPRNFIK